LIGFVRWSGGGEGRVCHFVRFLGGGGECDRAR